MKKFDELTYKLTYTPSTDTGYGAEEKNINFLCSDNKLHVRLREYDCETVIHGFIDKLTYLVTYLVNYVDFNSFVENKNIEFYEKEVNKILSEYIEHLLHDVNYRGIKILPCYRKIKQHKDLGFIPYNLCPYSNGSEKCSLHFFLQTLNTNIYDFLFNDSYEVVITKKENRSSVYSKFIKKAMTKTKNKQKEDKKVIKLW